ncbi:hypothetical protein GCM10010211_52860 [Streptomyces albospinus]|uniref:Transposase n=1 Tax=Streptomyces albospinus TaxID=285515 RepID=A0ABQ2VF56_9ACTN|nr:hypothetical protein GCM10010211_52860 [Streptomyces albospinus]
MRRTAMVADGGDRPVVHVMDAVFRRKPERTLTSRPGPPRGALRKALVNTLRENSPAPNKVGERR